MQMLPNEYDIEQPRKGVGNKLLLLVGLIVVLAVVAIVYYFTKVNRAATSESHEINFNVPRGSSTRQIATSLVDKKVISNKTVFIIYSTLHQAGKKIQAGEYSLDSNMTIAEVVDVLTHGKVVPTERNVTIIEGWSNKQIGKFLASRNITTADSDFEKSLSFSELDFKYKTVAAKYNYQGFMFPDTYTLSKNGKVDELIAKMLKNFESKFTDQMASDAQSSGRTVGQVLTVASIVEKEVGRNKENLTAADLSALQKERETVASVFYNRLAIGMPLESDATVNYITGKSDRSVTIEDTKIKSAYNSYLNKGLPPTPISNPGLNSIKAAIYPAHTNYFYFLNAPDGTAYFAKTLAEHNANKQKYLK